MLKRHHAAKSDATPGGIPLKRNADGSLDVSNSTTRELADDDLDKSIRVLMRRRESIGTIMAEVEKVSVSKTDAWEKQRRIPGT